MSEFVRAEQLEIKIELCKYSDESVKYTYTGYLDSLLNDDDGGFYGYDQARCDAAEEVDGDHMLFEDWEILSVECKI